MWRQGYGLVGLGLCGVAIGLAASIGLAANSLGASKLTVPRCTSAGLGAIQNLSGSNVVSVTISSLPASCGGATVQATVNNGSTNSSGSSFNATFSPAVGAASVTGISVVISG